MNAEIELKNNKANTLPVDAIVRFEGNQYVFVAIDKNNFEMMPVTVGATENGFIEILNVKDFGTKQIVIQGAYNLLMTSKNKAEE
jgi:cobalt-zinc-cadmium efflux system membrane fusion protein